MSSWIKENCVSFFELFCIKIIKTGRVPKHIAFIMDGNRRYAKKNSIEKTTGHVKGFDKLSETLKWCLDLGIPEVTVYAFSIENFKRSKEEVSSLMDLAREKFQNILDERDQIMEWGVRVHIAGRLLLLPEDLRSMVAKVMLQTKDNNKLLLNVAYAYTGSDEISRAASHLVDGVKNNEISCDDIDEDLISQSMDLGEAELLIRTSGEVRLSDFMLWQTFDNTVIYFTDVLWPEFTIWNLLAAIIHYQRHPPAIREQMELSLKKQTFLEELENKKWAELEKYIS